VAQCYSKQTGQLIDAGIYIDWKRFQFNQARSPEQINCLSTRGLLCTWETFTKVGGFKPRLLPHYTSDYEFTIRALRKGIKLETHPSWKLYSNELTTGNHHIKSGFSLTSIKDLFSTKFSLNPVFLSVFIALSCPWPWKLVNWIRVWKRVMCQVFLAFNG
jgi:GT2 family glycosyltransferase